MSLLLKDPAATLDYAVDWGAEYLTSDAITASEWAVEPDEPGGVIITASTIDGGTTTVTLGGGVPGGIYRTTNQISTAAGLSDRRSIVIRVEKR